MKNKPKLGRNDFIIILLTILFVSLFLCAWIRPLNNLPGKAVLTLRVIENVSVIKPSIIPGETIYLNGSSNPATIVDFSEGDGYLLIQIEGPAEKREESYNFNGQRVLIGQKAELHGSFFAQVLIESFEYYED